VARGHLARHFFPHRVVRLPKGGPDGLKLARRMCGSDAEPADLWELVLYALPPARDEFPADVVAREREIIEKQTAEEGKPEQAWPKIVEGKLNGFFKTVALVEQSFVKDQKQTIGALVQSLGDGVSVRRFARVKIGED
jgi:elongation factor Ts